MNHADFGETTMSPYSIEIQAPFKVEGFYSVVEEHKEQEEALIANICDALVPSEHVPLQCQDTRVIAGSPRQ
jgi:hypothetical protein